MKLSNRLTGINSGGDDGWGVFYKARQMKSAGQPVIELTIGEHDIRTDPMILDAMNAAALGGATGYAAIEGISTLRRAVADRVRDRTGTAATADNVLIVPGGQSGLYAAHYAVLDPGDRALMIDPYYATYPGTIRAAGGVPVPVAALPEAGFQPQEQAIRALAAGARSLLINSPNNPTGVIYSRDTMHGIARAVTDHDLWLISDEVYETQVWDGEHLSPRALPGMAERTLVVGSMSKSHAMTGSRVGWIVADKPVIDRLYDLSINTTYGVAGFVQHAATHALGLGPDFEARIAAPFRRRRAIAERLLAAQNAVRLVPSGGAMYLMLDIRATGLSGREFAMALLRDEGIATMPGESFGTSAGGHIRVAMTVDDDRFTQALARLLTYAGDRT